MGQLYQLLWAEFISRWRNTCIINNSPEKKIEWAILLQALRVSMEEQRQRQEQEARKAGTDSKEAARPDTIKESMYSV